MIFTSFQFLIFFPAAVLVYYLLPSKARPGFLLVTSYYCYINLNPAYAILLAGITIATYVFTIAMSRRKTAGQRKALLVLNIAIVLLPLFFFKYYNFLNDGIFNFLQAAGIRWPLPAMSFILPVGISFYTFMAIGYSIDVHNEEVRPEQNFVIVALFLSFFPILLSGPIERAKNLFPQFKSRLEFDFNKIVAGLQLMLWGYFMKLVIANRAAILVQSIFNDPGHKSGASLFVALLLYPIQVYADLGGYSLLAIGSAGVLGVEVMPNFKRPFFSTSMSQFWRRWHISLISWLTDYIYTPLAFNFRKHKNLGIVVALMLTFLVSGLWHGAAMMFVFWGLLQGSFLSIEAVTNRRRKFFLQKHGLGNKGWFITASCLLTYMLFAFSELFCGPVSSFNQAFFIIRKIFTDFRGPVYYGNPSTVIFLSFGILLLFLAEWQQEYRGRIASPALQGNWMIRQLSYAVLIIIILLIGVFDGGQFIYFKF